MKINNRFIYGMISILLAAVIAFIAIPAVTKKTSSTVQIVRVKNPLERGQLIQEKDLELIEVGGFNLPEHLAQNITDVSGAYAAADLMPGDYILASKVSSSPLSSDPALNAIPDGMAAISVTTQTSATALSDKLQAGDIVRLYHYYDQLNPLEPVEDIPELRYVQILSVTDSSGNPIDYTRPLDEEEERPQTATITVLVSPEQAMLLTRYENEGVLHVALMCRNNKELGEELLNNQAKVLEELYPAPEALWETDPAVTAEETTIDDALPETSESVSEE